jgi:transcriptional regulator with XRE-family HTH domain
MAGVARAWVSQLERQKGNTSLDMLDRLAKALDVPVATLLAGPEPGASPLQPLPNGRKAGDRRTG